MKISDSFTGKNQKEISDIKSAEIVETDLKGQYLNVTHAVNIEIDKIEKIPGGVQVLVRAWKDGSQLGFGSDGSIETERFRFFNPPVLVDDPNGTIVVESVNPETGVVTARTLREDPQQAILESISHAIEVTGRKNSNIEVGKIGNTTDTIYSSTGDGYVKSNSTVWSTLKAGANETGSTSLATINDFRGSDFFGDITMYRYGGIFDTSALGNGVVISSATLSLHFTTLAAGAFTSNNGWYASTSSMTGADFVAIWDNYSSAITSALSNQINLGTVDGYKDFALNATGISAINKTGTTNMGIIQYWDMVNIDPNQSGGLKTDNGTLTMADETGTSTDPKLVIVHDLIGFSIALV